MKVALTTGAYQARSLIASAQRCVNLYPEINPKDSPFPTTHYPTPGSVIFATLPEGPVRGLYAATNGNLYAASASAVYQVADDGTASKIGDIASGSGPVKMQDNGTDVLVVDGTTQGFTIDLATNQWDAITQDSFYGSKQIAILDGYFVLTYDAQAEMYISELASTTFNSLDFTAKNGYPDKLQCCGVVHREIWLFGTDTTEVWFNTGDTDFTFSRMPGVFIQHGIAAVYSMAQADISLFWLSRDPQGHAIVVRGLQYQAVRISTHALEYALQQYSRIDDAIGFTYQMGGHTFYVLTFPAADATWVYDLASGQWHEWAVMTEDGVLHRHFANCYAFWNGMNLIGDYQSGNIYKLDPTAYTDNGNPILRVRSFPHLVAESDRVMYRELIADMEVGDGIPGTFDDPKVRLRYSDTKGYSWSDPVMGGIGKRGDYLRSVQFQRLGYARDRVFELSWSSPTKTALNGVYVKMQKANE